MRKRWIVLAMLASMAIAWQWDKTPAISKTAHAILDPTLGFVLNINILFGFIFILLVLNVLVTLVQKYTTDQEALREIKKEQKKVQEEVKKFEKHPEKLMELNQKQFELMGRMMKISMGTVVYTAVPFILLFRWFGDYFALHSYKFFGFLSWFWFYLIAAIVLSSILRKIFKVE